MFNQIQVLIFILIFTYKLLERKDTMTSVHSKRRKIDYSLQSIQKAMNGSHIVIVTDVSDKGSPEINVPVNHIEEMVSHINRMGTTKIQFGIEAQYKNDKHELKTWVISNVAVPFSDTFFDAGIENLNKKLSKYSDNSSGWSLVRIMEIQTTLIKYEEIIHRSGIFITVIVIN